MRIPHVVFSLGLVVLVVLLLTPRRHPLAYHPSAEVALQGVVQDVQEFYCPVSGETGTHLTLATKKGSVQVHVAPSRFLSKKQWSFSKGEIITVVGSPIEFRERQALIARSITRGTDTVAVRNEGGQPLWAE